MARVIVQIKTVTYLNGATTEIEDELLREFTVVTKGRGAVNMHSMASIIQGTIESAEERFRVEKTKTYSTNRNIG